MPRDASNYSEVEAMTAQELYNTTDFSKSSSKKVQVDVCKNFVPETYSSLDLPPDKVYKTFDHSKRVSKRSKLNDGAVGHSQISSYSQIVATCSRKLWNYQAQEKTKEKYKSQWSLSSSTWLHSTYAHLHFSSAKSDSNSSNMKW